MTLIEDAKIFVFASHDFGMLRIMCNKFLGLRGGRSTGLMTSAEFEQFIEHDG
jgi:ABC-type polysaccharide/polyol phosphate transport system ATPase subunit